MNTEEIKEGKTIAIIAYITFVGALIALSMNADAKNSFARFHIRQAVGIHLIQISLGLILNGFDSLLVTTPFLIFILVLWVFGLANAIQGSIRPIPIVGPLFQKWFKFI
tara:strand:+ start:190 stop:516 length:327 start_codon:yes stop_codon:yes gene_type:complete